MVRRFLIVVLACAAVSNVAARQATAATAAAAGVAGVWNVSIDSPHGKMVWKLSLKADGRNVTGTIGNDQMGSFDVKGESEDGKLSFKFGSDMGSFEFNGKLKDPDTLVGTLSGEGTDMACSGTRVK